MKKILVLIVILLAAASMHAQAQSQKVAYIESDVILKQLPEAQDADKVLKEFLNRWQDTLKQYEAQLQEKGKQLSGPISEEGKAKVRAEGEQLQQIAIAYRDAKFGNDGEYVHKQQELLAPIKERVVKAIEALSKDDKIGFVFDKAGGIGLIFADDKNDITFKVLDRLKRGK